MGDLDARTERMCEPNDDALPFEEVGEILFKQRGKADPGKYRGITLLGTVRNTF